jgi:UDP-2-acetamido-2-deoxy-ribo-hexuluronate aminotransferase
MAIQMVDLKGQYQRLKAELDPLLAQVINEAQFIKGPQVGELESALAHYHDVKHCITCGNGTDALQLALMALDIKPGAEIITPSFTYIATAEVIGLLGYTARFVEVHPDYYTIDPEKLAEAITPNTAAIMVVHLYGQPADMERILAIAAAHKIPVIEDNAQAIGATYTFSSGKAMKTAAMGAIGCTSFFPSKNLGCYGDGGAVFTNDEALAKRLRMIANHGQAQRYYHELLGINSRLDTLQAAVLLVKLKHLDDFISRRRAAANYYDAALAGIEGLLIPQRHTKGNHAFHQYTLQVKEGKRDALKAHLEAAGVPTMIYYPVPIHLQKAFVDKGICDTEMVLTAQLSKEVLSLPMHTELTEAELAYISETITTFYSH